MKIVILLSRIDQTGMTTNTLDLVKGLKKLDHDVYVITGGVSDKKNKRLEQILTQFYNCNAKLKFFSTPKGSKVQRQISSVLSILKILKLILYINPQVIHSQSPYMSFIPWMLRKKFTSTLHVNDLVKSFRYKKATHLIAISKETKEYAMNLFDYKEENITIVNHGVSKKYIGNMSEPEKLKFKNDLNIPFDKLIIGFVGSIEKRKGHDLLLNAINMLDNELRKQIHLVFLGSSKDGKTRKWLDEQIELSDTNEMVSTFEYQDPINFYDIYDIFILPSRLEGFPLVVIEAMLSGCCVIRSNTQGAYDQIDHGINGLLFKNNNSQELSKHIETLLKDPEKRLNLAKNGQKKALEKFTIEEMTKGTLEVYKKVLIY